MAQGRQRPQILLDWTTISYRSIMRGVVYLVLILALGGLFYYLKAARRSTPEEQALQEISRAERMYREAQAKAQSPGAPGGAGDAGQAGGQKGDVVDAEFEDLGEKKDK